MPRPLIAPLVALGALGAFTAFTAFTACTVETANAPCPCAAGYQCCQDRCIELTPQTDWNAVCPSGGTTDAGQSGGRDSVHNPGSGVDGGVVKGDQGVVPDSGSPTKEGGIDCAALVQSIAAEMYAQPQGCTAVVRMDHDSYMLLGFQLFCGKYGTTTEAAARAAADADTSLGQGKLLSPMNQSYIFYTAPGDFGGVAAVNGSGVTVFGGAIIWDGKGTINYPKTWRAAATLGPGCLASDGPPTGSDFVGYDLVNGGTALAAADVTKALTAMWNTALVAGMQKGGYVFGAEVLRYPRTVGAFDPSTAEWIVLLHGGWLE